MMSLLTWARSNQEPMNQELKKLGGSELLTQQDLSDFSKAKKRILQLMSDGAWHTATEIIEVTGQREGLRRLRDLRGKGIEVEVMRDGDKREFLYRIKMPAQPTTIIQGEFELNH
jgi:hypothetical protein